MFNKYNLAVILCIILFLTGLTAFADEPSQTHIHIQYDFGYRWVCDTNSSGVVDEGDTHLDMLWWENINEFTDYDADGNPILMTWRQSLHMETYNALTGELLYNQRFTGQDSYNLLTDVYTISGGTQHLFMSRDGTLYHEAGRISVNMLTGEVLEESGQHSPDNVGTIMSCSALNAGNIISWELLYEYVTVRGPR